MATKPLVVIVGPTASGKTGLAIRLAKKYSGEVICADSRTVYKGMDIGTAKPSLAEQDGIPHWGLDIAGPSERYTAAQFKEYATEKIAEIRDRGKMPIIAGGTGLYIDSVLFDYQFPKPMSTELQQELEPYSVEELQKYCLDNNIELPIDDKNKRRLLRTINDPERTQQSMAKPIENSIVVGIVTKNDVLRGRIHERTDQMFLHGVVDEATILADEYGWEAEAMTSNVYQEIKQFLDSKRTIDEVKCSFETRDWQLAKRQMTWFRRNPFIEWGTLNAVEEYAIGQLGSE